MLTLGPILVFLVAASLPVIFLLIASRWIEADDRRGTENANTGTGHLRVGNAAETSPLLPPCRLLAPTHRGDLRVRGIPADASADGEA